MINKEGDEVLGKAKTRMKTIFLMFLCLVLFPVPLYFAVKKRKQTTVTREYREWIFCLQLLAIELFSGEEFTPAVRNQLFQEEFK